MAGDTTSNKRKKSSKNASTAYNTRSSKGKRTFDEMAAPDQTTGFPSVASSLLETGKYSDLTITCLEKIFRVHRNIICLQSKPLAAMVDGGFLEAKTGVINLEEEDPEIFERVLKFLYTSDYSDSHGSGITKTTRTASTKSGTSSQALIVNTKVYISADKWDIPALKKLAVKKFEDALHKEGKTSSFVESLGLMFEETPESDRLLKEVALKFAGKHHKELIGMREFLAMCKNNGEIAVEVLMAAAIPTPSLSLPDKCPSCGQTDGIRSNTRPYWALCGAFYCEKCNHGFNEDLTIKL